MAMPANKSSSSPVASKPNPNLRNSEIGNPMRRSFTGNPFSKPSIAANPRSLTPNTPVNSPSETLRRSSMGRATVVTFRECDDKENGKDQNWKPIKVLSPSPNGSKGAKNFMSPTISAASKVTPSPRKKILAERNEPARSSSVSLPDLKRVSFDLSIEGSEEMEVNLTPNLVFKTPKTECPQPVCENASEEPDSVNLDPSFKRFKISPPSTCPGPVIAPLDADPSAPPYDPKTNYLSPRPQFLHYRPNPRIERYLSKEKDGKRLEESFIYGSFSDTDTTEDTQSEYSQKELEDVTSDAVIKEEQQLLEEEEEQEEEDDEVPVSEPQPIIPTSSFVPMEEVTKMKGFSKPGSVWRSKLTALLLMLAIVLLSVSVTHSPAMESSVLTDLCLVKSEVAEFARSSFNGLATNYWFGSAKSPMQYYNLTMQDTPAHGFSTFDQCDKGTEGVHEFDVIGNTVWTGNAAEIEALKEVHAGSAESSAERHVDLVYEKQADEEAEEQVCEEAEEQVYEEAEEAIKIEALEGKDNQPEVEASESKVGHADPEYEEEIEQKAEAPVNFEGAGANQCREENAGFDYIVSKVESNVGMEEETVLISQSAEVQTESSIYMELHDESEMSSGPASAHMEPLKEESPDSYEVDPSSENVQLLEEEAFTIDETTFQVSMANVLGVLSFILALIGSAGFIYAKKMMNSASKPAVCVVEPLLNEKLDASPVASEMSSFSPYRAKGLKTSDEAESQEKRLRKNIRRESLASADSSLCSPSFGSFTTYEKIPVKHGHGEEEIVTPVRRSSRIRKQVTSPS